MRIGILKTGHPPKDMAETPPYAVMIGSALGSSYSCREFDVTTGNLPQPEAAADAYFITGSAAGVHDREPWIASLRDWLTTANPNTPLVGICFGHQIMAQAYGGVVETSDKGWGVGLHKYEVSAREQWMDDANSLVLPVVHRDQVVGAPATSRLVATSAFCPYAALTYTDRRAVSFQGHPEFALDFTAIIIDRCQQNGVIGVAQADLARRSMRQADDRVRVFDWIRRFLGGRH